MRQDEGACGVFCVVQQGPGDLDERQEGVADQFQEDQGDGMVCITRSGEMWHGIFETDDQMQVTGTLVHQAMSASLWSQDLLTKG